MTEDIDEFTRRYGMPRRAPSSAHAHVRRLRGVWLAGVEWGRTHLAERDEPGQMSPAVLKALIRYHEVRLRVLRDLAEGAPDIARRPQDDEAHDAEDQS